MKRISKPTILALVFFGVMTLIGISATHAQNDTVNPLFSTTGPNVLPAGSIQWNNKFGISHTADNSNGFAAVSPEGSTYSLNFDTRVRFGIGQRAELSLALNAAKGTVLSLLDEVDKEPYSALIPSVGAKLLLFEGKGWRPMVAFNTSVGFPILHNRLIDEGLILIDNDYLVRPTLGLQFRNRLGSRWLLDYSLDFTWVRAGMPLIIPTLQARWLATDRLLLGAGIDEDGWNLSGLYQLSPDLQLSLKGYYSLISDLIRGSRDIHAFVGLNWTLRNPSK